MKEAKELWIILGFDANKADFKSIRVIGEMYDELQQDKASPDPMTKYRATIYFYALDGMIE